MKAIWKFIVRPERVAEFEQHYGVSGTWVRLFRGARGYIGTELYRSTSSANEYITIDTWESEAAYEEFRAASAEQYGALDREMETLTLSEERLA